MYNSLVKMKKLKIWLTLFLLVVWTNGLLAQSQPFVYELKKRDFFILPLSFGMWVLGGSVSAKNSSITLDEIALLDRNDINRFDRCATYNWSLEWSDRSDLFRDGVVWPAVLLLSIPPLFHTNFTHTLTVATMFAESYFLLKGITAITKTTVARKRPFVYNMDYSIEERLAQSSNSVYLSFFSGHTATAFWAATFLSKVMNDIHGNSVWTKLLWGTSLSLAALTGYARVKAGMHYPSDVIVGAVLGFAIGYLIPALHKKKNGDLLSLLISPHRIGFSMKF